MRSSRLTPRDGDESRSMTWMNEHVLVDTCQGTYGTANNTVAPMGDTSRGTKSHRNILIISWNILQQPKISRFKVLCCYFLRTWYKRVCKQSHKFKMKFHCSIQMLYVDRNYSLFKRQHLRRSLETPFSLKILSTVLRGWGGGRGRRR